MGQVVPYFRRSCDVFAELEIIEEKVAQLEISRQRRLSLQKQLLAYLLLAFMLLYPSTLLLYYTCCVPSSSLQAWLHVSLFALCLPLFLLLRRVLHWAFVRGVTGCDKRISTLREEKQRIVDRVLETETYKKAKQILDRFDPDRLKQEFPSVKSQSAHSDAESSEVIKDLRQMESNTDNKSTKTLRPISGNVEHYRNQQTLSNCMQKQQQQRQVVGEPPRLPRPVLSRERSFTDRIVDILVGDGADRRFALICRRCHGHNGMALAEEFPYISWRCAYCNMQHDSRSHRPLAPVLESQIPEPQSQSEFAQLQQYHSISYQSSPAIAARLSRLNQSVQSLSLVDLRTQSTDSPAAPFKSVSASVSDVRQFGTSSLPATYLIKRMSNEFIINQKNKRQCDNFKGANLNSNPNLTAENSYELRHRSVAQ